LGTAFVGTGVVGSRAYGVAITGSDVDIVVFVNNLDSPLDQLSLALQADGRTRVELIASARVPVLKVRYLGVEADVVCNVPNSVGHVGWFLGVLDQVAHLKEAIQLCKHWMKVRSFPAILHGGFPQLSWLLLVAHTAPTAGEPTGPLACLSPFLSQYSEPGAFDGTVSFLADGDSEKVVEENGEAENLDGEWHRRRSSAADSLLRIRDPVGGADVGVGAISVATLLFYVYEIRRAARLLDNADDKEALDRVLTPQTISQKAIPVEKQPLAHAALFLVDGEVRIGAIKSCSPHFGSCNELSRRDWRSSLQVRLFNWHACRENQGPYVLRAYNEGHQGYRRLRPHQFICFVPFSAGHLTKRRPDPALDPETVCMVRSLQRLADEYNVWYGVEKRSW